MSADMQRREAMQESQQETKYSEDMDMNMSNMSTQEFPVARVDDAESNLYLNATIPYDMAGNHYENANDNDFVEEYKENEYNNQEEEADEEGLASETVDFLPSSHPFMSRIHATLHAQLTKRQQELKETMNLKQEELNKLLAQREETGVNLYFLQQNLSKKQQEFEKVSSELNEHTNENSKQEKKRLEYLDAYTSLLTESNQLQKITNAERADIDVLQQSVNTLENYLKSQAEKILLSKKEIEGEDRQLQEKEKIKLQTDEMMMDIKGKLKTEDERTVFLLAQIKNQNEEKKKAEEIVGKIEMEVNVLNGDKKQLIENCKSAFAEVTKRDTIIRETKIRQTEEKLKLDELANELRSYQREIRETRQHNSELIKIQEKLEKDEHFWIEEGEKYAQLQEEYMENLAMQEKREEMATEQNRMVMVEGKVIERDIMAYQRDIRKLYERKTRMESEREMLKENEKLMTNNTKFLWKEIVSTQKNISNLEMNLAESENELSRLAIDILEMNSNVSELKMELEKYTKESEEQKDKMEKYEVEIKNRHDKIEKKQILIANLNKKFETMSAKMKNECGEEVSPLESIIINLKREIEAMEKNKEMNEKNWIRLQNDYLNLTLEIDAKLKIQKDLHYTHEIYSKQLKRVEEECRFQQSQLKEIENSIQTMHSNMVKMNELIATENARYLHSTESNFGMEQEFQTGMQEKQENLLHMQQNIENLTREKESIMETLVETEKQIFFWEQKIELEKNLQSTFDPSMGRKEIEDMKHEISKMEARLKFLQKETQRKIEEMEKNISKNLCVENFFLNGKSESSKNSQMIRNEISKLKTEIKNKTQQVKEANNELFHLENENSIFSNEIIRQQNKYMVIRDENSKMEETLQAKHREARKFLLDTLLYQKAAQVLEKKASAKKVSKEETKEPIPGAVSISRGKSQMDEECQLFLAAIEKIRERFPHHSGLRQIETWMKT